MAKRPLHRVRLRGSAMIEVSDLRVDDGGAPCVDGLTFRTSGERVLILGAPRELMRAAMGLVPIARGVLLIDGAPPAGRLASGATSAAMLDAPMPPDMSPLAYVTWSARLAGLGRSAAESAEASLASVGIAGPAARATLKRAPALVRRGAQLAAALVPESAVLLLWDPLGDLEPPDADAFAAIVAKVLEGRKAIVFAGRAQAGGALASAMSEMVAIARSKVVAQGAPSDLAGRGRSYYVRALGEVDRFVEELVRRGGKAERGPERGELSVELGTVENVELFRAAVATGAVVIEMRPLAAELT